MSSSSNPARKSTDSTIDLPLLPLSIRAEETEDALISPPIKPTRSPWRSRFWELLSPGFPLTPPPRYSSTFPSGGTGLQSVARQSYLELALGAFAIPCCIITLLYAYGSTLEMPKPRALYLDTGFTIFILWTLSQASMLTVRQLVNTTFDRMRWVLASKKAGILLTTFLNMSPATTLLGVIRLLVFSGKIKEKSTNWERFKNKLQLWIIQRFVSIYHT